VLCGFYAVAMARVLADFGFPGPVRVHACRGMGHRVCQFSIAVAPRARPAAPSDSMERASE